MRHMSTVTTSAINTHTYLSEGYLSKGQEDAFTELGISTTSRWCDPVRDLIRISPVAVSNDRRLFYQSAAYFADSS